MRYSLPILSLLSVASALPQSSSAKAKPPSFFLAGDSTTAVQSTGGGGWGDGFLNTTLFSGAKGKNFGHNGATTVSFRAGGDWAAVLAAAKAAVTTSKPYVTIQFGHNDQKADKNISMAAFTANLEKFVAEVRAVPATPVLVTSLSRRSYKDGKVVLNLADVVAATKQAATNSGAKIIDLNAASTAYLNAIGEEDAHKYNLNPTDNTHLNSQGSVVFGTIVAGLLDEAVPEVKKYVKPVRAIADAVKKGQFILPTV
ncbi:Hypothetical protein D9617_19g101880 [Elsinoe fawcettii]|nr:Hypothetical protein D9617_19g101880 [Elsinoe fawcettii]